MKRCIIIGAVEIDFPLEKYIRDTDFVICADKGWQNAVAHGIKPDMIVGDFDSSDMPQYMDADVTVLPVVKDDTDTYYVSRYAVENGFTDVLLRGVIGGRRIEHTIANIQTLLYFAKNRVNATAIDKYSQLMVVHNGVIALPDMENKYFSVFSMGDSAEGVSIKGAKYPLIDYTLTNSYPIGVSNEFIGETVEISVKNGSLLLIISDKD
ncbi:MAG: thiamine diphosphokinase [Oscillospiraceae bacterium]|nr:thiamine diphosphokinase [Oscillospiraceae bacterium]